MRIAECQAHRLGRTARARPTPQPGVRNAKPTGTSPMLLLADLAVGLIFGVAIFVLLGEELKSIARGVFLLGHGANLAIIAASGSPIGKIPPVLGASGVP